MYGMNNDGKLFYNELNNWLIDQGGLKHSQYKMSIYYNCTPDESQLIALSYVDDCVYFNTY